MHPGRCGGWGPLDEAPTPEAGRPQRVRPPGEVLRELLVDQDSTPMAPRSGYIELAGVVVKSVTFEPWRK
jgi:hypothetical protein